MDDNLDRIIDILDHEAARDFADQLRSMRVTKCTLGRPTAAEELIEGGVPPIPARDIVTKFQSKFHRHRVGVFWDLENMSLVDDEEHNPADQINSIRDHIMERFGEIIEFNAYGDVHKVHLSDRTRTALQDCGVRVIDAAHVGRKEVADKMIIVDALWFALQDADPLVCIISRDSDFSPLLSKLRMKQIPSLVITTSEHVRSLRRQATWALAQVGGVAFESPKYDGPPRNFSRTVAHGLVPLASPIAHSGGGGGVAAQPSPGAVATTTADSGSSSRPFADLVRAVKEAQSYCHAKCVYRSRVAPLFYQINPMGDFKEESRAADAAGVVKMGGKLGYAWIALAKDDVTAETGMPHTAPSERTLSGTSPWHITLRYSAKYPCYDFMESFDDADDKVMHRVQDSHMFTVVVLGPFPSQASAEQYFKTHFGKTGLIPYIVQQLPLSVLRLVMNSGPSAGGGGGSADDSVGSEAAQGDGSGGDGGVVEVEEVDAAVDQQQSDAADDEEDASAVEAADHRSGSLVHGQYYTLRVSTQFNKFCHQSVAALRDAYSYGSGKDPKQPEAYEIFVFGPFPTKEAAENHFAQHFKQLGKLIPWYCTKFYFPVTRYSVP